MSSGSTGLSGVRPPTTPNNPRHQRVSALKSGNFELSTPIRTNSSSIRATAHTKVTVDPVVLNDMKDFTKNASVDKWVETVCGREKRVIDGWEAYFKQIGLFDDKAIKKDLTKFCSAARETPRYSPLSRILKRILELAKGSAGKMEGIGGSPPISDISFFPHDNKYMRGSTHHRDANLAADRKPDILVARKEEQEQVRIEGKGVEWSAALMCVELKFVHRLTDRLEEEERKRKTLAGNISPPATTGRRTRSTVAASTSHEIADLVADTEDVEITERVSTGSKRSRHSNALSSSGSRPAKKTRSSSSVNPQPRVTTISMGSTDTSTEAQIGGYALEMLSSSDGTRMHSIVVAIRDDLVSLWYFDSSGIVRTCDEESREKLSLLGNFERVAAIFVALAYCSPEQFGAPPAAAIAPPPNAPFPAGFPLKSLKGCTVSITPIQGGEVWVVTLHNPIYIQYTLVGRRTIVYSATTSNTTKKIAVKMSLQYTDRLSEADVILYAKNRGVVKHLPKILGSKDCWKLSDGIRALFGVEFDDRILRMVVTPLYVPLAVRLAENPQSLKTMVLEMIQCIHDLRYRANILHRDISDGNIMYDPEEDCFILNDYDLAARVHADGRPKNPSNSNHRTGTLPFMACDLLDSEEMGDKTETPVIHCIKHDLESVFWVALWCSVAIVSSEFALKEDAVARATRNQFLSRLETDTSQTIADRKSAIVADKKSRRLRNVPFSPSFSFIRGWLDVFRRRLEIGWKADKEWKEKKEKRENLQSRGSAAKQGEKERGVNLALSIKDLKTFQDAQGEITLAKLYEDFEAYDHPPPVSEAVEEEEEEAQEAAVESEDDWPLAKRTG